MTRTGAMIAAALLAAAAALAAQAEEAVTSFTLDNGMQVVVVEDHRAPVVQHMVWYRAGSADEPVGSSGVAHFLEHLLFKATDTMEAGEFSATVAANGGRDNAFTSYDYTAYFQRVAADRLELMMKMEADRMNNIRLTEAEIVTERDVILEERNQRTENNPRALFSRADERGAISQPPLRRAGDRLETRDGDAGPGRRAVLLRSLLFAEQRHPGGRRAMSTPTRCSAWPRPITARSPPTRRCPSGFARQEPPQTAARRLTYKDARVAQPYVMRSYLAPERDSGDQEKAAALTLLAEILGGGTTSFLTEKLQFDTKTAVYTGAFYGGMSLDDTTFELFVVPADGVSLAEAEAAMDAALAAFIETGVDPEQLERIKMQLRAAQIYERDNVDGIANRYGRALTSGLTIADVAGLARHPAGGDRRRDRRRRPRGAATRGLGHRLADARRRR